MLIKDVLSLLKEYNETKTNTTLAGKGGAKANGKNYDNIISGKTKPYKGNEYETKYAKVFPALAALVKKLKSNALKGDIIVNGKALTELQQLMQAYNPRQTPEGDYSLPFGDNVRLKQRGNVTFIGYHEPEKSGPVIDTEKIIANGPVSSDITK
jgi:hypothetical protein